jgi:hypothetical protein
MRLQLQESNNILTSEQYLEINSSTPEFPLRIVFQPMSYFKFQSECENSWFMQVLTAPSVLHLDSQL